MELHLSEKEIAALRSRERDVTEKTDLVFRACPFCAFPTWIGTHHEGTGKTTVVADHQLCDSCVERRYSDPRVFEMIVLALRGDKLFQRWSTPSTEKT